MAGIVLELQREALDRLIPVSDLLRKALLVAKKLRIVDIENWILCELNGYSENDVHFPAYRWIGGEIKSHNPYSGMWLPIMFPETLKDVHESLTRMPCNQSIAEIENLLSQEGDRLIMHYKPETQAKLIKAAGLISPPVLIVSEARMHGIIDAVRTSILEWALKLEENGIKGENLSFSDDDRKAASHLVFNIGQMANSQIQAETSNSRQIIQKFTLDPAAIMEFASKVRDSVLELELDAIKTEELKSELDTLEAQAKSPKPKIHIITESLKSVRSILEGALGRMAAEGMLAVLNRMFM